MGKHLYQDSAAEREANDVGRQFMNSSDVVGDMSRAYGTDLSSVQIHTDSSAAQMTAQRGVDAFSTGSDIFFGQGVFNQSDPASRGLLAHELSHSMQQGLGGGGSMQQSAPMGAEQGGFLDFFRRLFGIKSKEEKAAQAAADEKWQMEKAKKLSKLDAEDAQFARWKQESQAETDFLMAQPGFQLPTMDVTGTSEQVNLTQLLAQANEKGWSKYGAQSQGFDAHMTENFFRELSGRAVSTSKAENGDKLGNVFTGYRSMEDMMEVFNNHNEETTLRVLKPLMDLTVKGFTDKYPIHKMNAEKRQEMWPQVEHEMQSMIGLKQWGEKYGLTTLSPENQKKFDRQCVTYMQISSWALSMGRYQGLKSSLAQTYEMDIKDIENQLEGSSHTTEMNQRLNAVKEQINQSGEVVPYDQFKTVAAPLFPKRVQDPEQQIHYISRTIPGFGYNKDTNEVITPIPMADLKNLSRGDKKTLNRYADQLRSLSWLDENGRERRGGEYDASTADFMANFEEDFTYFSKMSGISSLLNAYDPKFLSKQKDARDLSDKAALANSTYTMMHNRAHYMNSSKNNRYQDQFGENDVAPTWYKRQILEQNNVLVENGPGTGKVKSGNKVYQNTQSHALAQMVENAKNMDPEALKDPKLMELVLKNFQTNFGAVLQSFDNASFDTLTSSALRGDGFGELGTYNTVLKGATGDMVAQLAEFAAGKDQVDDALVEECLNHIADQVVKPGAFHDFVLGGLDAFRQSAHFKDDPYKQSKFVMNNLVLRGIVPQLVAINPKLAHALMKAVNSGTSPCADRLRGLLSFV